MKPGRKLRVSMVGSMPPPLGGVTVLFQQLVTDLRERDDVDVAVSDVGTADKGAWGRLVVFLRTVVRLLANCRSMDVLVICTVVPYDLVFSLLMWGPLKVFGGKLVIRKFAGNLDTRIASLPGPLRWLYEHVLFKADLWLLETRRLVELYSTQMRNVKWYSNSRPASLAVDRGLNDERSCRRFVYLGHVRPMKGIAQLIEAAEQLRPELSVDVYGPFMDGLSEEIFQGCDRVKYKGSVPPDQVVATLARYDALVLPTYASSEGYPGVILEAYCAGLPVIASDIGAIGEIVDETSGVLVEPKDVAELRNAMQRLADDEDTYRQLCHGTQTQRNRYSSSVWADNFVEYCRELVGRED